MVTVKQVRHWLILQGDIGHVLFARQHGWHTTLCDVWTPNGTVVKKAPPRKCRKCIKALKGARLKEAGDAANGN